MARIPAGMKAASLPRTAMLASLPLALLVLSAGILPFASAVRSSLYHDLWGDISWAGLSNFRLLFEDRSFVLTLGITLAWAVLSVLLTVFLGFALACALLKAKGFFKVLYLALLVPWGVPSFISVPLWRMILHGSGGKSLFAALFGLEINLLTDPLAGFFAALAVDVWLGIPLVAFAAYAALGASEQSAIEAARLDGAGSWDIARWIWAPQARTTLLVLGALEFVKSFKEFSVPFLMTAGGPPFLGGITEKNIVGATTTLEIFLYDAFRNQNDYGVPSAYAVVVGILVIALVGFWFWFRNRVTTKDRGTTSPRPGGAPADKVWEALLTILPIIVVASSLLVIYAVLWLAFSDLSAVYIDGILPRFLSLRPFAVVLGEDGIARYFLNTMIVAGLTAVIIPLVAMPAAWALSRAGAARSAKAFAFIEGIGMTGGIHSLIPLYVLFRVTGLLGGYTPIVIVYLFHAVPFSLFTLKAFLDRIPPSFEEAARLEGMGTIAYMLRVLVPLGAPALAAAMMAAFISAWNGFLVPLVFLTDDRLYTIGIKLHGYVGSVASGNPRWNLFAAASIINMLLIGALLWKFKEPLRRQRLAETWQ